MVSGDEGEGSGIEGKGMSFIDGKPWIATFEDCKVTRWNCSKSGERFRCALCGHKFMPGNTVRWQYTNDTPGAGGNPFVCHPCDTGRDAIIAEILRRRAEINSERNWWFVARANG